MPEAREWELVVPRMAPSVPPPPSFLTTQAVSSEWTRHVPYLLPGVVTLCLGLTTWKVLELRGAQFAPTEKEWVTGRVAADRSLTLHRSSLHAADYQFEFNANLERGVSCVLRAMNSKNYYAVHLDPDLAGGLRIAHFAVLDGIDGPRVERIVLAGAGRTGKVRLEAFGNEFSVFVDDHEVHHFTDGRLKTGGVGFVNERGEAAGARVVPIAEER